MSAVDSRLVEILDSAGAVVADERFRIAVTVTPGDAGEHRVELEVAYLGAEPVDAAVRFRVLLPDAPDPWWLIPGAFYGENRPAACTRMFPRFEVGGDDPQGMVSDHWEFRADRCATPAVFAWGASGGAALVAEERSPLGMAGVGFAHDAATATASIHLTFPFREGPVSYYGSAVPLPAEVTTHHWQPGERARVGFSCHDLGVDRHAYAPILRRVREAQAQAQASPVTPWLPVAEAAEIAAEGLLRWHYDPDPGVLLETVGFDREVSGRDGKPVDRQAMHVGWVSGIPWAFALLTHGRRVGDAAQQAAATRVIDFICENLSPSGSFWGTWYRDGGWSQSWTPIKRGLHARTLAEATLFLLRCLELGEDIRMQRPAWRAAARSNLDLIVGRQRTDGNVGSVHHAETGEVLSWSGAAGLTWVAALAEAARWDADGRYLAAAVRAGEYYAAFVEGEFIFGAPEDVDLAPTSEDGYAAVMAYIALHRRTGQARWLELARRAADWMLTFRYSYNVTFDPRSMLGVYGFATRGADQASPSNQHLHAYGLVCTDEMYALSDALGDRYYRQAANETLACFRQLVASRDGQVNSYRGMITERYYQTECFQPKGMLLTLSHAWCAGVLLLACEHELGDARNQNQLERA
ncbi:MAG: hypothetical protein ACYCZK_07970 [Microbacteriaceae bacterium]